MRVELREVYLGCLVFFVVVAYAYLCRSDEVMFVTSIEIAFLFCCLFTVSDARLKQNVFPIWSIVTILVFAIIFLGFLFPAIGDRPVQKVHISSAKS